MQGEPQKVRGEAGKRVGVGDNDERGSCGPINVLKEIEIENEIYKKKKTKTKTHLAFPPSKERRSVENEKRF